MRASAPAVMRQHGGRDYHNRAWRLRRGTDRGTQGSVMLRAQTYQIQRNAWDTMTTRTAALVTIALLAVLLALVALAALFAGDISERTGGIISSVLGTFATVLAGLLLFLRVETVNAKVDDAATHASVAAQKAADVASKVETVHHDILNGGLRENVKRAISEDRHMLKNREAAAYAREQLEARGMPKRDQEADE